MRRTHYKCPACYYADIHLNSVGKARPKSTVGDLKPDVLTISQHSAQLVYTCRLKLGSMDITDLGSAIKGRPLGGNAGPYRC